MPLPSPIAQFPNPPILGALAAAAVARAASGQTARSAGLLSDLALLVWAYQEISDGANWFRRLLGLGAGTCALGMLVRRRVNRVGS